MISFVENHAETAEFLGAMRELARVATLKQQRRKVDFDKIKRIAPAAALCVVSEFDRWRLTSMRTGQLRAQTETWDPHVRRLLCEMGFFEVLGVEPPALEEITKGHWIKFKSGVSNDGQFAKELRQELEGLIGKFPKTQLLYDAIVEAMANAIDHAYPEDREDFLALSRLGKRWWMSGSVDQEGRVQVIFFDQGITIPRSLPRSKFWERVRGLMTSLNWTTDDGHMIAAAVQVRRSATEQEHRGKGFANILRLLDDSPENKLRIISRRGSYTYVPGREPEIKEYNVPLNGTLIAWDLSLTDPILSGTTP
ncbi:MAG: hypothetical protein ACK4FJ_15735 [Ferrovibrio sp.]|uniref:hypothetical protein n=1 Tax=Ferrovibrio sp. TaxID=1917215 RepID=UPI00391922F0